MMRKITRKRALIAGGAAAVLIALGSGGGIALAGTSSPAAPPPAKIGCDQGAHRALAWVFENPSSFYASDPGATTADQVCAAHGGGFAVSLSTSTSGTTTATPVQVNSFAAGPYPGATKLTIGSNSTSEWAAGGTLQTSWVECPSGYIATGGGFGPNGDQSTAPNMNDGKVVITSSAPDYISSTVNVALSQGTPPAVNADDDYPSNGWAVQGYNNGSASVIVRPWVVCLSVSS